MVKVSIIPTILIWIVVTVLRIASLLSVEAKIDNLRNIQSVGEKSTEDNHSINLLMIGEKIPLGITDDRGKRSSPPIYKSPTVKLKIASSKRDDDVSSVLKKEIEENISANFLEINNKSARLTLADLNGPSISQDVERIADEKLWRGLEHVRVKRELGDSDSFDEIINGEDNNVRSKEGDESGMRNDSNREILIGRNETRYGIVRAIGSEADSLKARYGRRKRRNAPQSQLVGRVRRGGRKKSHHKSRKHKHRKRPKNNRHFKKMAKLSKAHEKLGDDVGRYRSRKTISKSKNLPGKLSALVTDQLEIESRVEKRDSGDARSEIDVKKREVLKDDELAPKKKSETLTEGVEGSSALISAFEDQGMIDERDDNDDHGLMSKSGKDFLRVKRHENGTAGKDKISNDAHRKADELKYYEDANESNRVKRGDEVELRGGGAPGKKRERERAAKSVKEIKNLMDKLVVKVNELDSYVEKRRERDEQRVKSKENKRGDEEEDPSSLTRCVDADLKTIKKSEDSITCVDKTLGGGGGGGFKSKLETERSRRQGVGESGGEIASEERKRSTETSKRTDSSEKKRKKRKPHRKWDRWTDWSSCSVTCGKGRQIRWRHCVHDCTLAETEMEEKTCQLPACGPGKFLGIF